MAPGGSAQSRGWSWDWEGAKAAGLGCFSRKPLRVDEDVVEGKQWSRPPSPKGNGEQRALHGSNQPPGLG